MDKNKVVDQECGGSDSGGLHHLLHRENGGQTVGFWYWFFADTVNTSLLTFTFLTFLFGVVATLMVRTVFKTLRQFRKMRKENQVNRLVKENAEMRSKAAMLQTRTDTPTENQADQT